MQPYRVTSYRSTSLAAWLASKTHGVKTSGRVCCGSLDSDLEPKDRAWSFMRAPDEIATPTEVGLAWLKRRNDLLVLMVAAISGGLLAVLAVSVQALQGDTSDFLIALWRAVTAPFAAVPVLISRFQQ
ncbi:hypothetical protein WJX81_008580 [Elliptochloris bilobata]|uniref:Uncharacterized protein n=1 Tax=Elliptochloris bilobata TaxID=381761 RepID=A0AAW1RQY0_9CHLO